VARVARSAEVAEREVRRRSLGWEAKAVEMLVWRVAHSPSERARRVRMRVIVRILV